MPASTPPKGDPRRGRRTILVIFSATMLIALLVGWIRWSDREPVLPWGLGLLLNLGLLSAAWSGRRWLLAALSALGAPGGIGLLNLPERLQPYGWALLVVTTPWLYPQAFPADLEAFQEAQRQKR